MTVTTVTNTTDLETALHAAQAGDTILLAAGTYSPVHIDGLNINGAVNIQSQDVAHQGVLTGLYVSNSSGLNFSNLELSRVGSPDWFPFRVTTSSNVNFTKLNVHGSVDGITNDMAAVYIAQSSNVTITKSDFHDLSEGITHADSNNLTFSGNTFHDMQNHGIQGAGTSNIVISQNSFTDFYPLSTDHPDAIIFWTDTVVPKVHGITLTDNVITRGHGGQIQGIWLRDSAGGSTLSTNVMDSFSDVTITGNRFYGTMWNGIGVLNANHVTIGNNVVQGYPDMQSWIRVQYSDTIGLNNNQSQAFVYDSDSNLSESSNQIVGAADPASVTTGTTTTTGSTTTGGTTSTASLPPPEPDAVTSSVTYTLGSASHSLTLTGTANIDGTGNDNGDAITGNVGANHLTGGAGNDTISDGGIGGADSMAGNGGDDVYYVNNARDVVTENSGGGTDTVSSSVTYVLGANVENLVLTGSANIDGTGNGLGNHITGNSGANHLYGGAANDWIDGGAGADSMNGGAGDDTYTVDNSGDQVIEKSGQGVDLVQSLVSYALGSNVENLVLTGSNAIDGNGNANANRLTGNGAANRLSGDIGADTIDGGAGNDLIIGAADNDLLTGGAGADIFKFAMRSGHDVITDFKANGDADQIDISYYTSHRYAPTIVDHGAYTTVSFSTGDSIDLLGVHASDLHLNHGFLL